MKKKLLTIFLITIIASIGLGSSISYADDKVQTAKEKAVIEKAAEMKAAEMKTAEMKTAGLDPSKKADENIYEEMKKAEVTPEEYKEGKEKGLTVKDIAKNKQTAINEAEAIKDQAKIDAEHLGLKNMKFSVGKNLSIEGEEQDYFKEENPIVSLILRIIDFATTIMGSIAIIILIVAGFMFMFAQGNQQQLDEAKEVVKYALMGLALTFFSYIITIFIQSMFIS